MSSYKPFVPAATTVLEQYFPRDDAPDDAVVSPDVPVLIVYLNTRSLATMAIVD
jgi:hypothetical protein